MYNIKSLLYNTQKHRNALCTKSVRLRSIFTLKSAPQLRFLYIVRLMSHMAMGFAPICALRLRRAFLNQGFGEELKR
ncbi:hypothetical protein Hanom_Chr08g00719481 [Helianthus anomalus]